MKNQIFALFNDMEKNPTVENYSYRNRLFNIIVKNGWLAEYMKLYKNEFGL